MPRRDAASGLAGLGDKMARALTVIPSDFDWSLRPRLPRLVPRPTVIRAISQFHHGELIAARLCALLPARGLDPGLRPFLDRQFDDEARHTDIYRRYLDALGGVAPLDAGLGAAAERVAAWRGAPEAVVLACHLLLETESLQFGRTLERWLPCPLFRAISAAVARDEARHVAFGRIYLKESLPALSGAERHAIYRWLKGLWYEVAAGAFETLVWIGVPEGLRRAFLERQWARRADWLVAVGLVTAEEARRTP